MPKRINKFNVCLHCKKEFKVADWNTKRKYCSNECKFDDIIYRQNLSKSLKGKFVSDDTKRKIRLLKMGCLGLKGKNNPMYNSKTHKKVKCPTCGKLFISDWKTQWKKFCSIKCLTHNPNIIKRQNKSRMKDRMLNPEKYIQCSKNIAKALKNKPKSLAHRNKLSNVKKEQWNNMSEKERTSRLKKWWNNRSPNKMEQQLDCLLKKYFGDRYRYVGDGSLFIAGKNPDFIGHGKRIIELFGRYWHQSKDEEERHNHFAKYGYRTLIIWDNEMKDLSSVLKRLESF